MKNFRNILLLIFFLSVLPDATTAQYWDDLYIRPSTREEIKKKQEEQAKKEQTKSPRKQVEAHEETYVPDSIWDIDAYNRRYETEAEPIYTDTPDTIYMADEEDGYYLNGFYGTQSDLEYAERIRKFHNPRFTVHISDPAYNDIYFLNSFDWNVYIDGTYAFVTPTWTNPWYWDYTWAPYSYWGPSWRWNSFYWGWGYPYYGFGWSWGYPHHHHYYPPHYGPGHRPPHHPDYRPTPQNRPSYSPGGWSSRRPNRGSTIVSPSGSNDNLVIINSQGQRVRNGNTSRSSQRQSTTRQIERQRNYNQTYTPNYNNSSSRGSSISSGGSGSRGSMSSGSRGGSGGGSRSRR